MQPPFLNGNHQAPQRGGGAFPLPTSAPPPPTTPTAFLADLSPYASLRTLLYHAVRQQVLNIALIRFGYAICLLAALAWTVSSLPGRWWVSLGWLLLASASWTALRRWQGSDFVRFQPEAWPAVSPSPLQPQHKIALYATGEFDVEGKVCRFTYLPGFYRTFATREHALLCRVNARRFLGIATWPAEDNGLWYLFITPAAIENIRWGTLCFGDAPHPAIALDYRRSVPAVRKNAPERTTHHTVFLAAVDVAECQKILADLLHDAPVQPPQPVSKG
jgi:hypothetical protein